MTSHNNNIINMGKKNYISNLIFFFIFEYVYQAIT